MTQARDVDVEDLLVAIDHARIAEKSLGRSLRELRIAVAMTQEDSDIIPRARDLLEDVRQFVSDTHERIAGTAEGAVSQ